MTSFTRLFVRFIVIGFGFFFASLAAGIAYVFLARLVRPEDFGSVNDLELTLTLVFGTIGVASLMARAALAPALLGIALFEFLRLRDWLSHAIAGAVLGLGLSAASMVGGAPGMAAGGAQEITVHTLCGIFAALAYWLVAGRNAGKWLEGGSRRDSGAASGDSPTDTAQPRS